METLQTGVTLCNLAKLIESKAAATPDAKVGTRSHTHSYIYGSKQLQDTF
jgi:hypothetical protein